MPRNGRERLLGNGTSASLASQLADDAIIAYRCLPRSNRSTKLRAREIMVNYHPEERNARVPARSEETGHDDSRTCALITEIKISARLFLPSQLYDKPYHLFRPR